MKQFLMTMAGVVAGLAIFLVGAPIVLIGLAFSAASAPPVPARAVLELDLREPLTDQEPHNTLLGFGRRGASVMSIIETLHHAESDGRVKGLLVRLPEGGVEPGMADELRDAFGRFRKAGKLIIAHSQGIYPSGVATTAFMLGAAADQFWMQPGSALQVTGVSTEDLFFKRLFDKYGVAPQFEQRAEYKNAVNGYLQSDYTPAHREATLSWLGSVYDSNLASAAKDRKTDASVLRSVLEAGPYGADRALQLKLIDHMGQVREAEQALLDHSGEGASRMDFRDYADGAQAASRPRSGDDLIAVIEAEGAVMTGHDTGPNPLQGGGAIYSDDLAGAILEAAHTDAVKAIVLRLNSPGGSDTASEQILDAIRMAKAKGKPVVVSMSSYGASGGYWIASEASAIVAQPTTLTGSIGVFGGKFALGPALARLGVDVRRIGVGGEYAGAFGLGEPFTAQQRAAFAGWMDQIYAEFVTRVASGRKLSPEKVREIAKGRVWTGAQARALGLVDELGGFYQAVDKAKALAGLTGEVQLKRMTPSEGAFDQLQRMLGVSATSARTLAAAAWVMGDPRAEGLLDRMAEARMRVGGRAAVLSERVF